MKVWVCDTCEKRLGSAKKAQVHVEKYPGHKVHLMLG